MKIIPYGILSITLIFGLILSSVTMNVNADQDVVLSPRKQMAEGVEPKEVKCKSGLILMIRSTNGYAACVTSHASAKLATAGWGEIIESNIEMTPPIEPIKNPESEEEVDGKVIGVSINDGIGSNDR